MAGMGINSLFVLGGNGTHAGAQAIYQECEKRNYECAVVGVPKTIDNDILHVRRTCLRSHAALPMLLVDLPIWRNCAVAGSESLHACARRLGR